MSRQDQKQLLVAEAADSLPTEIADRPPCARSWPVLASIVLHGVLLCLLLLGGSGEPVGAAGTGGGVLSVFEVGLVSLTSGSEQNTAPQGQDMLTEPAPTPEQEQQAEPASMPEDATALRAERPPKHEQQPTQSRRPARAQSPLQAALASEKHGESSVPRTDLGGMPDRPTGEGGLGTHATPGTVAGDGRPFGFQLGEVNGKPKVVKSVPVVYPVEARKKGITGQVLVRFHLDENGTISHLHIKSAKPPDVFNQNTLAALRQWRFQPAQHNRQTVPVWVELPIEFELR